MDIPAKPSLNRGFTPWAAAVFAAVLFLIAFLWIPVYPTPLYEFPVFLWPGIIGLTMLGIAVGVWIVMPSAGQDRTRKIQIAVLFAVLLIGLGLRVYRGYTWNSYRPDSAERLVGDEPGYDNLAREILSGYGYTWPGRVPLYPLWLAGLYWLGDGSYGSIPYMQVIPGLGTVLLAYLLGSRAFDERAGLIAAGWSAVSYIIINQGFHLLSEALYTPFMLMVGLSLWRAWQRPGWRSWLWAGIFTGLSTLIRPTLLLFPMFVLAALLVSREQRARLRFGLFYLAVSIILVLPWAVYNYTRYQAWFPLQTSNALLWQGSPEYYHLVREEGYTYIQVWQEVLYGPGWTSRDPNSIEGDRYWTRRALRSIAAEPLVYLKYAGEKVFTFWVGDPNADWNNTYVFNYKALRETGFHPRDAYHLMIARFLPIAALAAVLILRKQWQKLLPLYLILAYFTLLHALTHAEARLSEPLQPLLLILIAAAVVQILDRIKITKPEEVVIGTL